MTNADIERFDRVIAVFSPTVTDDLRDTTIAKIGTTAEFFAIGIIDEGRYAGQMMFECEEIRGWVPFEDLQNIRRKED